MSSLSIAVVAIAATSSAPVQLSRTYVAGERSTYRVQSTMQVQSRGRGLNTWMPEDISMRYEFTTAVEKLKADGIAQVRYKRPSLTMTEDSGEEDGPSKSIDKLNWDYQLTLSPMNKILEIKDLTAKKNARIMSPSASAQVPIVGEFIGEVYRLALFAGGIDSSLDLAPPLPLWEVAPGDSWKSTVSYQPQKVKGKDGKSAVQRLDYTYTYKGIVAAGNKKVHRVVGELDLNTDLAEFINQTLETTADESNLKSFPLHLKTKIDFDLDLKTLRTLTARANSQGGFQLFTNQYPDDPAVEQKLTGGTTLSLLSAGPAAKAPVKATPKKRK